MSEASMDILNDGCLLQILELLTLKERVKVELVCKRWQRLCRQLWKNTQKLVIGLNAPKYYSFGYMCSKPILLLEPLLKLCGKNLRSLTADCEDKTNVFELIARYCNSLNSLSLELDSDNDNTWISSYLTDPGVEEFCAKLHSLTEIKLCHGNLTGQQLEKIFISQPNIKSLQLECIKALNNRNFNKLNEEVESISISDCGNIENDYIIWKLTKFKNLKKLYISTYNILRINELVKTIPQIEHLTIISFLYKNEELREIGVLKNLRSLNLNLHNSITDDTIAAIVENCRLLVDIEFGYSINDCPVTSEGIKRLGELPGLNKIRMEAMKQLTDEVLEILASYGKLTHVHVSRCGNFTDRGVIALLEHCPHLQKLIIEDCKITKVMLHKILEVAKARPLAPPLHVFIKSCIENLQIDASKYQNTCLQIINDCGFF